MTRSAQPEPRSTDKVIHLEDARMRRRERGELALEGLTGLTLLDAAQSAYSLNGLDAFIALNAVAGVALVIVVARGAIAMLRNRDAGSTGVNVVGVFGGLAAVTEGIHRLHTAQFTFGHKHFALGAVTVLAGLLTVVMATVTERLEHRRALSITSDGVRMRLNKFRRFSVPWDEIVELRVDSSRAQLMRAGKGPCVVPLGRLVNRDEVSEALVEAARERGVPVTESVPESVPTPDPVHPAT